METILLSPFGLIALGTLMLVFAAWAIKTMVRMLFWCACVGLLVYAVMSHRTELEAQWNKARRQITGTATELKDKALEHVPTKR